MEVVPQNECELSDFPSKIEFSINHLKRILIVIILKLDKSNGSVKCFSILLLKLNFQRATLFLFNVQLVFSLSTAGNLSFEDTDAIKKKTRNLTI